MALPQRKSLGIPLYDRNVLEKEAEEIDSTLHSLVEFSKNGMSESGYYKMAYPLGIGSALKKDRMFELQSKLVLKHAESENCVIIGRCADYLLRERENVIRCYIFASLSGTDPQQHHDAGTRQRQDRSASSKKWTRHVQSITARTPAVRSTIPGTVICF